MHALLASASYTLCLELAARPALRYAVNTTRRQNMQHAMYAMQIVMPSQGPFCRVLPCTPKTVQHVACQKLAYVLIGCDHTQTSSICLFVF